MIKDLEKVELKPCPFCGRKPRLSREFVQTEDDEMNSYVVGCDVCDIYFRQMWDYDKIVKQWNTRVKDDER